MNVCGRFSVSVALVKHGAYVEVIVEVRRLVGDLHRRALVVHAKDAIEGLGPHGLLGRRLGHHDAKRQHSHQGSEHHELLVHDFLIRRKQSERERAPTIHHNGHTHMHTVRLGYGETRISEERDSM